MDLKSREAKKLTDLQSEIRAPSFSPDGQEIVFLADVSVSDSHNLWLINWDGSNPRRVDIKL